MPAESTAELVASLRYWGPLANSPRAEEAMSEAAAAIEAQAAENSRLRALAEAAMGPHRIGALYWEAATRRGRLTCECGKQFVHEVEDLSESHEPLFEEWREHVRSDAAAPGPASGEGQG